MGRGWGDFLVAVPALRLQCEQQEGLRLWSNGSQSELGSTRESFYGWGHHSVRNRIKPWQC